ncbi:hypothetical protein [uncultured Clostridium sp.]|uniref:hypothetical protein n=1 Tax=uncultured Clostridium sp. TaxID=59620 RepID=UPI0025D8BE7B|nr:hypothetical protein [uncultured Clostridium sp.]
MLDNNTNQIITRELKAKAIETYAKREQEKYTREFIDNKERSKDIHKIILNGEKPHPKELLALIYEFNINDKLINKCKNKSSLRLDEVVVKGIKEDGKYGNIKEIKVSESAAERVLVKDIPEEEIIDTGEDFVKIAIESEVKEKVKDKLINILDSATLEVTSTDNKKDDLLKAIEKLGKKHKVFTIVVNSKDYIELSNSINDLSPYDIIVDDNISNMYIGNLQSIVINYVIDKVEFSKDIVRGIYTVACAIYNLTGYIADETAICKIV